MRLTVALALLGSMIASGWANVSAAADNHGVVSEIRRILATDYVVPEKRKPLDQALANGLAAGRYDRVEPRELAERLTADMAAVAHDGHLNIRYSPAEAATMPAPRDDDSEQPDPFMDEIARRWNQGVTDLRVMEGNVRYLNYRGFMWSGSDGKASKAAIDGAMAFLREGDAIIIDLRENGGGSPDAVRYLTSFFVPANTPLMTFHYRSAAPVQSRADANVAGGRIVGKPIYVLTAPRTFSAAEEFSAHVRRLGFGTLVGTPTGGGAYNNALYPVQKQYVLSVSVGRPELPGGGNWEGKGVEPKVAVAPETALDTAAALALRQVAAKSDDRTKPMLLRVAAYRQALADRLAPAKAPARYVGRYGERAVTANGSVLSIQRDNGPISTLVPMGGDRFALSGDPATQVAFTGQATVDAMDVERADGSKETIKRNR